MSIGTEKMLDINHCCGIFTTLHKHKAHYSRVLDINIVVVYLLHYISVECTTVEFIVH